jgi:hypothetical protein
MEVESVRRAEAHFTHDLMNTILKAFQDAYLRPLWDDHVSNTPDEIGPPLFLSTRDRDCLQEEFDELEQMPSSIFRCSHVYYRNPGIMSKVCPEEVRFCRKALYYLFCVEIREPVQRKSDQERSITSTETRYWVTIKLSPEEHSLEVFVRGKDQPSFISNKEANVVLLNRESANICNYWGYEPYSYRADEIKFVEHLITDIGLSSGVANAWYVFSDISQQPTKSPILEPENVVSDLHEMLSSICGHTKDNTSGLKRNASEWDSERPAKRSRSGVESADSQTGTMSV